jgi:hypothetical protein
MTTKADAFRYGVLIGLREAGCTEKIAYEILDDLEASKYDLVAFTTPAHVKVANALIRGAVSAAGRAAKAAPKTIDAQFSVVKHGSGGKLKDAAGGAWNWLKQHPKTFAGGAAVGGLGLGRQWGYGSGEQAGQAAGRQEGYEAASQTRLRDLHAMMQMMQQMQGGGIPSWYNPRAIYGG